MNQKALEDPKTTFVCRSMVAMSAIETVGTLKRTKMFCNKLWTCFGPPSFERAPTWRALNKHALRDLV